MNELEEIKKIVDLIFNINLREKSRKRINADGLKVFSYLARKYTNYGLVYIADFVNREHTTIIHHLKSVTEIAETDRAFAMKLLKCESYYNSSSKLNCYIILDEKKNIDIEEIKQKVAGKGLHSVFPNLNDQKENYRRLIDSSRYFVAGDITNSKRAIKELKLAELLDIPEIIIKNN